MTEHPVTSTRRPKTASCGTCQECFSANDPSTGPHERNLTSECFDKSHPISNMINVVIKSPASQTSQDPTRQHNLAEAQRVYAATQAAYARQQVERTSVANSPANFTIGVSPVQLGTSPMGNGQSPAIGHDVDGNSNVNGNTVDRAPTPASAKGKKKPARITIDTEVGGASDLDAPQSGAASATSKRKTPSAGKRPLKSATTTAEKPVKGKAKVRQFMWRENHDRWLS